MRHTEPDCAAPATASTSAASNDRVLHDTPWLSASDIPRKEAKAREKLIRASVQPAEGQANTNEVRHTEPDRAAPATASTVDVREHTRGFE